jgi:hypothetical protein
MVHRAFDAIEDMEGERDDKLQVDKILNGKFIKVGSSRVGYVANGLWRWTAFALARYSTEQLSIAKSYAEEE